MTSNGTQHPLEFIPPNETRTLVGAAVNPSNETTQIISLFQDKVAALTTTLNYLHMSPCDVLLGHKFYWCPDIKYTSPDLNFSQQINVLRQFNCSLLPSIKVNRNLPMALIPISPILEAYGLERWN